MDDAVSQTSCRCVVQSRKTYSRNLYSVIFFYFLLGLLGSDTSSKSRVSLNLGLGDMRDVAFSNIFHEHDSVRPSLLFLGFVSNFVFLI